MARRRTGTVRQLASGRWQARYRDADGILRSAPRTFDRRGDAARWLVLVEADMQRGTFIDPEAGRLTVGEWAERWLAGMKGHIKIKTYASYALVLRTKVLPRFGDMQLSAVKPIMVTEWVAELREAGLSPSRIRQSHRLLSQVMKAAVDNDIIAANPCRGVKLPKMPESDPHILTPAEVDRIIAAITPPHDALVMLLGYAGLRIGEAFAIRRRSIDLKNQTVVVSESLVEVGGHLSFDTPKSHQRRTITVPRFVSDRLAQRLTEIRADDQTLLFTTRTGLPLHYQAWRGSHFDRAVRAGGLVDVTPHDLRASHATWVAERYGVMAAAARLGHAHASVTTRHYARTLSGQDRVIADDFDRRKPTDQ